MNAEQIWEAALGELRLQMTKATFDSWLMGARFDRYEDDIFFIAVGTEYARDWLQNRLSGLIKRTLTGILEKPVEVQFVLRAEPPVMEIGCNRHVAYSLDGEIRKEEEWYIKLRRSFADKALRLLKGAALSVFIYLACKAGEDGEVVGVDEDEIAVKTGWSRNTVRKALKLLDADGGLGFIISRDQHHSPRRYSIKGYAWLGRHPKPSLLGEDEVKAQNLHIEKRVETQNLDFDPRGALTAEGVTEPNLSRVVASASPEEIAEKIEQYRWLRAQGKINKNGPGFLVESILKRYGPPKGYPG